MGTRSVHGLEVGPDKIQTQFLHLDGMPKHNGAEYYHQVVKVMAHSHGHPHFCNATGVNENFIRMVKCWLNWVQWRHPNNYQNNQTMARRDWNVYDGGQHWMYLWHSNGDFSIWDCYQKEPQCLFTLPYRFTYTLIVHFNHGHEVFMAPFWEEINKWPKRSEQPVALPILELDMGQVQSYPDQTDQGWRDFVIVRLNGGDLTQSMFAGDSRKHGIKTRNRERLIVDGKEPLLTKVV